MSEDEIALLFAITVDELHTDDVGRAMAALRELWERVEDPAMLREAVEDAGDAWADLLPMVVNAGGGA